MSHAHPSLPTTATTRQMVPTMHESTVTKESRKVKKLAPHWKCTHTARTHRIDRKRAKAR